MSVRATTEFLGTGEYIWYVGIVVSTDDPLYIGRVRIRAYGWHDSEDIRDNELPFAQVITPITNTAQKNIGTTPLGLAKGTTVVGFFLDGRVANYPVILGTLPGITDNVPDMHELARPKTLSSVPDIVRTRNENRAVSVSTARGGSWTEPEAGWDAVNTLYPYNIVYANGNGYVREVDGSPDNPRVAEYTKAGGYREVKANGNEIVRVAGSNYTIIAGSDFVSISGNANLTVAGTLKIKASGIDIETDSYTLNVAGESRIRHAGDASFTYGAKRSTYQVGDTLSRHDAGTDKTCPSDPPRLSGIDCSTVPIP